ncbi:MAG: tetratricopeptide repeat protein [Acidobacteriota bacterium]|nr:tetratricopeptide repeat protein [Acidobacteriota bacterium]
MHTNSERGKTWTWVLVAVITLVVPTHAQNSVTGGQPTASLSILDSTRDQDGLAGSVRRVKIQSAKLALKSGQMLEGPLQLLEITTYGLNGNRIDNASYPVADSSVGTEVYRYNDRGNIIEMTLRGRDGSILSRENYEYELDAFGNWRKMLTSLVLFENGQLKHEPVAVTYREIAYYFDDRVAKIVKPISPPIAQSMASPSLAELANTASPNRVPDISTNSSSYLAKGAVAYYEKGREYFGMGALKEAVDSYRQSIELEPRSAEVYLSLGHAYLKLKNSQEAGKAFKQATVLDPEMAEAHYGLGLHYFGLGRYKDAANTFKRATLLRPDMAKAHYGLAHAYQVMGKLNDLIAQFRILENLDRVLAKKLSDAVPELNLPCRVAPFCK